MSSRTSGRKRKEPTRLSDESSLETKRTRVTKKKEEKPTKKAKTESKKAASPKAKTSTKKTASKKTPAKKASTKASSKKKTASKKTSAKKTASKKGKKAAKADDDDDDDDDSSAPAPAPASPAAAPASPVAAPAKAPKAAKPAKAATPKAAAAPKAKVASGLSDELYNLGLDDLKARLRANDVIVSGSKKELVKRIIDCVTNGCPPRCPQCSGGRLTEASKKGNWKCKGYFDDDVFKRCSYTTTSPSLVPWVKEAGKDY